MSTLPPQARDFNPRSSREERRGRKRIGAYSSYFNPRSSREERRTSKATPFNRVLFQSTLLAGGATCVGKTAYVYDDISIHAPRGRSDIIRCNKERSYQIFQSTLLAGGATIRQNGAIILWDISIHAPRGRSDDRHSVRNHNYKYFNPRSSREERQSTKTGANVV